MAFLESDHCRALTWCKITIIFYLSAQVREGKKAVNPNWPWLPAVYQYGSTSATTKKSYLTPFLKFLGCDPVFEHSQNRSSLGWEKGDRLKSAHFMIVPECFLKSILMNYIVIVLQFRASKQTPNTWHPSVGVLLNKQVRKRSNRPWYLWLKTQMVIALPQVGRQVALY